MDQERDFKSASQNRPQQFAIDIIGLTRRFPLSPEVRIIPRQLIRSSTSVGANYRAASRAQSRAHFIVKLSWVEEEADEPLYWMQLVSRLGYTVPEVQTLMVKAEELVRIIVASKKTARRNISDQL